MRGLHNLRSRFSNGSVATIGNYDGVHLGHKQILDFVNKKSKELGLESVVVVFEPQPEEFFTGDMALRLSSLREKITLFEKNGIDNLLVLPFNAHFASVSALDFVRDVLVESLKVKYLVVGDDFVFGHRGIGDCSLLKQESGSMGFRVQEVPSFKIEGVRVSSSLIRSALYHGDLEVAARFLGRSYKISGRVVHGDHIGHDLGFPTANIHLRSRELPFSGVYLVKIGGLSSGSLFGLANLGVRPTLSGKKKRFEVYIFDFNANIYGKRISIEFCKKIRDEKKFESLEELKMQIKKDLEMVSSVIASE